jgi:hypothetical protein
MIESDVEYILDDVSEIFFYLGKLERRCGLKIKFLECLLYIFYLFVRKLPNRYSKQGIK